MTVNRILVHYGEIALKGKKRPDFQQALRRNIQHRIDRLGLPWLARKSGDHLFVVVPDHDPADLDRAVAAVLEVPGIVWVAPALWLSRFQSGQEGEAIEFPVIEEAVLSLAAREHVPGGAFAVRVKRADKRFALSSDQLEHRLGARILGETPWERVDLGHPDRTFHADIQGGGVYIYGNRQRGIGGLPVGMTGRVLALLSGGIDSPVAAFLAAKRGCSVDFLHFTAAAAGCEGPDEEKIAALAARLSHYTLRSRLFLVPAVHFELALLSGRTTYELVLFRRFMARVAERLADRLGAQALVTGDALGQVASQTLENMVTTTQAIALPIIRPVVTYDKHEIMAVARSIGTYATSIRPSKDCCSIMTRNPRTTSQHATLASIEKDLLPDYGGLIDRTLGDAVVREFDCGEEVGVDGSGGEREALQIRAEDGFSRS